MHYMFAHCSVREVVKLFDGDFLQDLGVRCHQERSAPKVEPTPTGEQSGSREQEDIDMELVEGKGKNIGTGMGVGRNEQVVCPPTHRGLHTSDRAVR